MESVVEKRESMHNQYQTLDLILNHQLITREKEKGEKYSLFIISLSLSFSTNLVSIHWVITGATEVGGWG